MIVKFNSNSVKILNKKTKLKKSCLLAGIISSTLLLTGCNKTMFDTKYGFDKVLILGDDSAIVLDVYQWKDYSGEQLQINFNDDTGFLSSFVNVTLVNPATPDIVETIANAFSGNLNKDIVKIYK